MPPSSVLLSTKNVGGGGGIAGPTPHLERQNRSKALARVVGSRIESITSAIPRVILSAPHFTSSHATTATSSTNSDDDDDDDGGRGAFLSADVKQHDKDDPKTSNTTTNTSSSSALAGGGGASTRKGTEKGKQQEQQQNSNNKNKKPTHRITTREGTTLYTGLGYINSVVDKKKKKQPNTMLSSSSSSSSSPLPPLTTTQEALDEAVTCDGARHLCATSNHWVKVHLAKEENLRLRSTQRLVGLSLQQQLQESQRQHDTATGYTERHALVNQRRMDQMETKMQANYEQFLLHTNKREIAKHCHASRLLVARATQWSGPIYLALTAQLMLRAVQVQRARDTLKRLFINRFLAFLRRKKMLLKRREEIQVHEEQLTEKPPNEVLRRIIPVLSNLPEPLLDEISDALQKLCFLPSEFITYLGEPGDTCFILGNGVIECTSLSSEAVAALEKQQRLGGGGGGVGGGGSGSRQQYGGITMSGDAALDGVGVGLLGGVGGGGGGSSSAINPSTAPQSDLSEAVSTFRRLTTNSRRDNNNNNNNNNSNTVLGANSTTRNAFSSSSGVATLSRKWTTLCRSTLLTPEPYEHTFRAAPSGNGADFWVIQHSKFAAICDQYFSDHLKVLKSLMLTQAQMSSKKRDNGGGGGDSEDDGEFSSSPQSQQGGGGGGARGGKMMGGGRGGGGGEGKSTNPSTAAAAANGINKAGGGAAGGDATSSGAAASAAASTVVAVLRALPPAIANGDISHQIRHLQTIAEARDWYLRSIDGRREINMVRYRSLSHASVRKASPLFAHWSPRGIQGIVDKARPVVYRRDDVVVREGRYGKALLIVVAGKLEMLQDGRRVELFPAGTCVADIAASTGIRNPSISVVALANSDVWMVDHKDIEALVIREDQNLFMSVVLSTIDEQGHERTVRHSAGGGGDLH